MGSGALYFWIIQRYKIKKAFLNELNPEVCLCYMAIQRDVEAVIDSLKRMEARYKRLKEAGRKRFYYLIRSKYNISRKSIDFSKYDSRTFPCRAAKTIFLNRTCFNGLYRVNSTGDFNVPFGRYKDPKICDEANLRAVNRALQNATITNKDFSIVERQAKNNSFIYFDPPYRPLNKTSNFTSYSQNEFDDREQGRLAKTFRKLDESHRAKMMLSNADPKNVDKNDDFFDQLYSGFHIERLRAKRMINCQAEKRGQINEILVMNY